KYERICTIVYAMIVVILTRSKSGKGCVESSSSRELYDIALEMAGMEELPADSTVYISGSNLNRVMFGMDIGPAELLLARELECDAVIAHHPAGGESTLRFPEV